MVAMITTGIDPQRICFAGDWHANTLWARMAIRAAKRNGADCIVHVGDFGFRFVKNFMHMLRHELATTGMELFFVEGNHDDWPQLNKRWPAEKIAGDEVLFRRPRYGTVENRIHYIPRGTRWEWNGKVFMGLGGAISVDRAHRTPYSSYWPEEALQWADVEYAMRDGRVDVMVCHDMPDNAELPNLRKSEGWPEDVLYASRLNREAIQAIIDQKQPELFVHGHFHRRFDQMLGNTHIVSLDMDGTNQYANLYYVNADLTEHIPQFPFNFEDYFLGPSKFDERDVDDNF